MYRFVERAAGGAALEELPDQLAQSAPVIAHLGAPLRRVAVVSGVQPELRLLMPTRGGAVVGPRPSPGLLCGWGGADVAQRNASVVGGFVALRQVAERQHPHRAAALDDDDSA